jgi:hypothetical protein
MVLALREEACVTALLMITMHSPYFEHSYTLAVVNRSKHSVIVINHLLDHYLVVAKGNLAVKQ